MRAVLGWLVIATVLIVLSLFLRELPANGKGLALSLCLFLVMIGLAVRITRN